MDIVQVRINAKKYLSANFDRSSIIAYFCLHLDIIIGYNGGLEKNEDDKKLMRFANDIDYFLFEYLNYLFGRTKTLRGVFKELNALKKSELYSNNILLGFLNKLMTFLEEREMYESMLLLHHSKLRIFRKFGIKEEICKAQDFYQLDCVKNLVQRYLKLNGYL